MDEGDRLYPESLAIARWGDGETYGCSLVLNDTMVPRIAPFYCGYVRFKRLPGITDRAAAFALAGEIAVHGGVTYTEYDPASGEVVYGFDCGHFRDAQNPDTRNLDWLKAECEVLREHVQMLVASRRL
jgi:hypothetical protein